MHTNKVSHIRTIDRVAKDLGEDVDFLFDVAMEMETEDGVIWVLSLDDDSVIAFTMSPDFVMPPSARTATFFLAAAREQT